MTSISNYTTYHEIVSQNKENYGTYTIRDDRAVIAGGNAH